MSCSFVLLYKDSTHEHTHIKSLTITEVQPVGYLKAWLTWWTHDLIKKQIQRPEATRHTRWAYIRRSTLILRTSRYSVSPSLCSTNRARFKPSNSRELRVKCAEHSLATLIRQYWFTRYNWPHELKHKWEASPKRRFAYALLLYSLDLRSSFLQFTLIPSA